MLGEMFQDLMGIVWPYSLTWFVVSVLMGAMLPRFMDEIIETPKKVAFLILGVIAACAHLLLALYAAVTVLKNANYFADEENPILLGLMFPFLGSIGLTMAILFVGRDFGGFVRDRWRLRHKRLHMQ